MAAIIEQPLILEPQTPPAVQPKGPPDRQNLLHRHYRRNGPEDFAWISTTGRLSSCRAGSRYPCKRLV